MMGFVENGMVFDDNNNLIGIIDRNVTESCILNQAALSQDANTYRELSRSIREMNDADFLRFMRTSVTVIHDVPAKDVLNGITRRAKENNISKDNSALNAIGMVFLPEDDNAKLLQNLNKSKPSDSINLDFDSVMALTELWSRSAKDVEGIPSDLFFANTIPLQDCCINIQNKSGSYDLYRFVVHSDFEDRIRDAGEWDYAEVANLIHQRGNAELIFPILTVHGVNRLMVGEIGYRSLPKSARDNLSKHVTMQAILSMATFVIQAWYGIQIALLHPVVKSVFNKPRTETLKASKSKHNKKRRTAYIKRHVINAEDIRIALTSANIERYTLVWYVIGHWRTYRSGRKVFVQPYWKGPLRIIKQNIDDRERVIITGGAHNA